MILLLYKKFPFILDRNLAKANSTENHVCTSCDTVVLGSILYLINNNDLENRDPQRYGKLWSNKVHFVFLSKEHGNLLF